MKTLDQITTAKRVPLAAVLASYGITEPKVKGTELVFKSPFRSDSTPSFSVDTTKNIWVDFGETGNKEYLGGSTIDLVMKVEKLNFPAAVDKLLNFDGAAYNLSPYATNHDKQRKLELLSTSKDFEHPDNYYLVQYAESRCISLEVLHNFCEVVIYRNKGNGKIYRAIGFLNDAGGYELRYENQVRSEGFKGCLGKKEISTQQIWKILNHAYLFEGFFDFLSWVQHIYNTNGEIKIPMADIFVINTLAIANRISFNKYKTVHCFFDNDVAGQTTYKKLADLHKHVNFINASANVFPNHNDYSDFLIWQNQKNQTV